MQVGKETSKLFSSTFFGRQDVVPKFWKAKNGRTGYSPICKNEWDEDLCAKKNGGSCQKCKNADYEPMSERLLRGHFAGGQIIGSYPLLLDNTCYFLAADFDKHSPTDPDPLEEVKAFVEVCEIQEIPVYVLRSKSGKGYHVYIFFESPIPAWKARLVGFALLKEAGVIDDE